jgi:queuine tRNA-ribosyltransferase
VRDHPSSPCLLGADWLARWRRSGAKFPADLSDEGRANFAALIESHPQFSNQNIFCGGNFAVKGALT